jgi:hypothetical protein
MKIAIVSAVWQRHNVFEMFAQGCKNLMNNGRAEIIVIVAGSEGRVSKQLVEKHGFIYCEMPNNQLAEKVNAPVIIARKLNVDYIFAMGSDDVISPQAFDIYIDEMEQGTDFIGVSDFYFYDLKTKRTLYWGGYLERWRKGHSCGAARAISKKLLNSWGWKVWEPKHNTILDNSIQEKLSRISHTSCIFSLRHQGVMAVDIKSQTNMTPFEKWNNSNFISSSIIQTNFPFICVG